MENFKYYAFISYSSHDTEWGKKLQRKLEHYKMPATLCHEHGWKRKPISPVFFAPTDIQPGGLSEELQRRLKASRNLIVICSPHSAQSQWVGKEIEFFHNLGRTKQIHFFIVEGVPHGDEDTECFNPVVETLGLPEILGANVNEKIYQWPWLNKERAYVQLISKLLGVEFDTIWQRHKRLLVRKAAAWAVGVIAVAVSLTTVWAKNQPFNAYVILNVTSTPNYNLDPPKDAVVTMQLNNETKTDTIHTIESMAKFNNIPHRFFDKKARVTVACRDFLDVDTFIILNKNVTIDIQRNPTTYGDVRLHIWNPNIERYMQGVEVVIVGHKAVSDKNGLVTMHIPIEEQQKKYHVTASIPLERDTVYMPCGEDDAILTK